MLFSRPISFFKRQFASHPSWFYGSVLILLVFVFFSSALTAEFLNWDDNHHVFLNRRITSVEPANIRGIFSSSINGTYIPLTIFTFALEYKFFGLNAPMYHLDNLILHSMTVLFMFGLGLKLGLPRLASFLAAAVFAVHPMHVESVVWVTERKDVLYAFFYMASLYFYVNYVRSQKGGWYILSLLAGAISVFAKPMALSLPWILLVMDWFLRRPWSWRLLIEKVPFVLAIEPVALITYTLNARIVGASLPDSFLIWAWTSTFYIEKFLLPIDLMPIYWLPYPVDFSSFPYMKAAAIFILFMAAVVRFRKERWFMFAVLFFVGSAFFLWRYDYKDVSVVADRFMYLPSLGFCFLFGFLFDKLQARFPRARVAAVVLLLVLGAACFKQALVWQKDMSFWETFFSKHPDKILAYSHVSSAMVRHGQYDMALDHCNKLLKLYPDVGEVYNNRGIIYQVMKAYGLALADFNKAIELNPFSAKSYNNRGCLYRLTGKYDLALSDLNKAIEIDGKYARAYYNKGFLLSVRGDDQGALALFNKAIKLNPMLAEAYNARGFIYALQEKDALAIEDLRKAVILQPQNIFALSQMAQLFYKMKEYDKALAVYDDIFTISPDNAPAFFERSMVYRDMGRMYDALMDAWKAKSLGYVMDERYIRELEAAAGPDF